jgi:basic membrane protein A
LRTEQKSTNLITSSERRKMKKLFVVVSILIIVSLSLAACQKEAGETGDIDTKKVVYLINGSTGDNAWYDSGQAGIDKLAEEFGVETRTIECGYDAGLYEPSLEAAVNYADVIFVISYGYEDLLMEYADKYPEKIFVNIDTVVENSKDTITNIDYIEEESAFLTGIVAGMVTIDTDIPNVNAEKIIGSVGGDTGPVIEGFMFAYENGAKYIDPEITAERVFLGDWEDTSKAKQATLQMYDKGADIVFQIAAGAGLGVLQASGERGLYSIGVDSNQNDIVPGHVVASDIKDVGASIVTVYETIEDGTYEPGETLNMGLASGAVDVVFEGNGGILPQYIIDKVDELREMIINGEYEVELYVP